ASKTCSPSYAGTREVNLVWSSTVTTVGIPAALHTAWSSSPKAGAQWTTPVPSSMVTKSAVSTWKALGPASSTRKSKSGRYRRPASIAPVTVPVSVQPASSLAYAPVRAAPTYALSPSFSSTAYEMSAPTARARLDGRVHGVVVHTAT